MNESIKSNYTKYHTHISSKHKLFNLKLREVWQYRDLIWLFTKRSFSLRYKQTILGPTWLFISPLMTSVVYLFVFNGIAGISTDGVPPILFYLTGTALWSYFSTCFTSNASTFTANAGVFGKVYFPRLTSPIATCLFHVIKLLIQCLLLAAIFLYTIIVKKQSINVSCLAFTFPLVILWIGLLGGSMGLIISSLTTKYRDLNILLTFAIQLGMYATPVVYPLSELPEKFRWLAYANPVCAPIEFFRIAFYGAGHLEMSVILSSLGATVALVFLSLILFTRNERSFVDVI